MALKLQRQYDYYKEHQQEFLAKHYGKFVVISEDLDVTFMDTWDDAVMLGLTAYKEGSYFIEECVESEPLRIGRNRILLTKERGFC